MLRQCIEPLGLTISAAAAALGVTRTTLSELVNERRGISPEMAVRLAKVFGGTAESWLTQQADYDLAQVQAGRMKLKRRQPAYSFSAWDMQDPLPLARKSRAIGDRSAMGARSA